MADLNSKRSRTIVFYASIVVAALAGVGLATAYQFASQSGQQTVVGDPTKRIGKGDGQSQNPITLPSIDRREQTGP